MKQDQEFKPWEPGDEIPDLPGKPGSHGGRNRVARSSEERFLGRAAWSLNKWRDPDGGLRGRGNGHGYTLKPPWKPRPSRATGSLPSHKAYPVVFDAAAENQEDSKYAYGIKMTVHEALDAGIQPLEVQEFEHWELRLRGLGNSRIAILRKLKTKTGKQVWLALTPTMLEDPYDPGSTVYRVMYKSLLAAIGGVMARRGFFRKRPKDNSPWATSYRLLSSRGMPKKG